MIATATKARKRTWTETQLQALPEEGYNHEVVSGRLIINPKNNFFHGFISARLSSALLTFVEARRLGAVLDSSIGFWMKNRNCRAPDISFITRARIEALGFRPSSPRFFPGAPDLVVEVLSPDNTRREMEKRLKDFFESGTRLAWIVSPKARRVEVFHSPAKGEWVGSEGFLDGEDLLPGFRHPIANLFKEWDWEQ
jgi:Uma2 family endonuclease